MTDMETVINCLRLCDGRAVHMGHGCEKCSYLDGTESGEECIEHLHADALALLKEQEPVKPIERNGFYFCGACRYAMMSRNQKFCSVCGKAVKWNG